MPDIEIDFETYMKECYTIYTILDLVKNLQTGDGFWNAREQP